MSLVPSDMLRQNHREISVTVWEQICCLLVKQKHVKQAPKRPGWICFSLVSQVITIFQTKSPPSILSEDS